jgi:NAD-dependent dihydropyrimidine dehydrogenase PreA subunit
VITIDIEQCTGCGACVEVCPTGALYLVEGKATLDSTLCRECEDCLAACPSGAITLTAQEEPVAEAAHLPVPRPEPEVVRVRTAPAPVPLRSKAVPVVGAALAWAGREILPWLADLLLDTLDRRTTQRQSKDGTRRHPTASATPKGGGQQRRHRRRGGRG